MQSTYYLKKLKEDFSRKKRGNAFYSLRAYARDLGVHPATLSQVLLGKRPLPLKNANRVIERMALNAKERTLFIDSLGRRHSTLDGIEIPERDERFLLDEAYFQIIAEWEHYAVLTLFDCREFDPNAENISHRLNIPNTRAEVVLDNLLHYGLLIRNESGKLLKSHPKVRTTEDVASQALQASHKETLDLGKHKLQEVPVDLRDFSSMMVALDLEKLPEAKIAIREFRQKMAELLKSGRRTEVYQLAVQLYPITKIQQIDIAVRKIPRRKK
jgi:uncharacterized protein (TIGR02147 family)